MKLGFMERPYRNCYLIALTILAGCLYGFGAAAIVFLSACDLTIIKD